MNSQVFGALRSRVPPRGVLVVDDDPRSRELVTACLEPFCPTAQAENGGAALELLERRAFDLVILDVMMPGMNGFEVCKRIKSRSQGEYLPVLMLTALGEQEQRNAGLMAGADDFLCKPVDRRELALRAQAFIRLSQQERLIRTQFGDLQRLQTLKDDLVSLLLHDASNPLQALLWNLDLLQRRISGSEGAGKLLMDCHRAAARLHGLLSETLAVRLLEEDEMAFSPEPVELHGLLEEIVRELDAFGQNRGVGLHVETPSELIAEVDPKLLRRAVENLLVNALKYSPQGEQVSLSAWLSGGEVVVEVADRGPGVPEELRARIFDKFGSVEAQRGCARRGFGLGLYLVKLAAQAHRGQVVVVEREGGGSKFRLTLPSRHPRTAERHAE